MSYFIAYLSRNLASMDPSKNTTREERYRRRAEEALGRGNRELAPLEVMGRGRATTTVERQVLDRDHQGGVGGRRGHQGGMQGSQVSLGRRGACLVSDQDEVEVLDVVVAHGNQALEEIREAAEVEIVEEAGRGDVTVGEVVELEEEEGDLEEVGGESGVGHIGVDEVDIEQQIEEGGHERDDLVEEADDSQAAEEVHVELEVAPMVEVDGSADSPLVDTIDLTDSPGPSQRCIYFFCIHRTVLVKVLHAFGKSLLLISLKI